MDSGDKRKLFRKGGFFRQKVKLTDLWVWEKIFKVREFLKKGMSWKFGNGRNIIFWLDNWMSDKNIIEIFGNE